jgi:hydrogenase/urease accessory protein HupE
MDGLSALQIDVLLRITLADGTSHSAILRPSSPSFLIPERPGSAALAWSYFLIGVKHILEGVDHLLFILGLLLIVRSKSMLIKTVTAFTLAHSITLAIATLGYASTPLPPLNVMIALSILFLGPEIVRVWRGQTSVTIRHPWVVAFAFGLLHGFGFASGLKTIGLPPHEIALSLLMFNVGVEAGQLFFVAVILALLQSFRVLEIHWPRWAELTPGYAVGSLGAYWTIQRMVIMLTGL